MRRGLSDWYGILEDQLHAAPQDAQVAIDRVAVEVDAAGARRLEAEQRARQRRLAAPRLAHEAERLAAPPGQIDAVHGAHERALPALEGDVQAAGVVDGVGAHGRLARRQRASRPVLPVISGGGPLTQSANAR